MSACFNLAYVGNQMLFPIQIVATSYGICNVFSRCATIAAPGVAEIKPEWVSEWIFVIVCSIALVASLNIRQQPNVNTKVGEEKEEALLKGHQTSQ